MIVIRLKGGLGNQLFQYATGYALARRLEQELQIDISYFSKQSLRNYRLDSLNIELKNTANDKGIESVLKNKYLNKLLRLLNIYSISTGKESKYLLETKSDIVNTFFSINSKRILLDGYFQSELYFKDYREDLIRQFTPNYLLEKEYQDTLEEIKGSNSIAIHVRRGDFVNIKHDNKSIHYILDEDYYHRAMQYYERKVTDPVFYWFSDDIGWVKEKFGLQENFRFVCLKTKHSDINEMMLMKNCKHNITANSTFSWWAAWLNENENAICVCPKRRYGNLHMIPQNWVRIE